MTCVSRCLQCFSFVVFVVVFAMWGFSITSSVIRNYNGHYHYYFHSAPHPFLAQVSPLHTMKDALCTDARYGTKYTNLQGENNPKARRRNNPSTPLDKAKEEGTTRSQEKQCTLVVHQIRTTHQEAFYKEVTGKWKGSIMPEDLNYSEKNSRNNQEAIRQESHQGKNSEMRDGAAEGTPINFHFN